MKTEETTEQKEIRRLSESANPYPSYYENRHLWSEGYKSCYNEYFSQLSNMPKTKELKDITEVDSRLALGVLGYDSVPKKYRSAKEHLLDLFNCTEATETLHVKNILAMCDKINRLGYKLPIYFTTQPTEKAVSDEEIEGILGDFLRDYKSLDNPSHLYFPKAIKSLRSLFSTPTEQSEAVEEKQIRLLNFIAKNEFYTHNENCFTSRVLDSKTFTSKQLIEFYKSYNSNEIL